MKINRKITRKIAEEHYYSKNGYLEEYLNKDISEEEIQEDEEAIIAEESWIIDSIKKYNKLINKPVETTNELPKDECPENYHAGPCECKGKICKLFRKIV